MFLYSKILIKDSLSRGIIFTFLSIWFVALFLSSFDPYGLYSVSSDTYLILILNVFSFVFGFSLVRINRTLYNNIDAYSCYESVRQFVYSKKVLLGVIVGILLCIFILRKYLLLLVLYDNERREAMSMVGENLYSIDYIFFSFFAPPLFFVLNIILAYMLLIKRDKLRMIIFVLYILVYSLVGGGRSNFLTIIIALFFVYLIGGVKISKQKLIIISVFMAVSYIIMSFLSAFRLGMTDFTFESLLQGMDILNQNFITYLTLPFRLLDYAFNDNYFDKIGGYHYGLASFDGVNRYIRLLLKPFSIEIDPIYEKTTHYFQNNWILIGKDFIANYAYTNIIYHYLDFGVFGVFIVPCLFASYFRWVIKMFYKKKNIPSLCLMFYLFYVLIHTVFSWHLIKLYSLGFILILSIFIFKKQKVLKNEI